MRVLPGFESAGAGVACRCSVRASSLESGWIGVKGLRLWEPPHHLGDIVVVTPLLDRLVHHGHPLKFDGKSWRL